MPSKQAQPDAPWFEATGSRYLLDWMADQDVSLAFTTYQAGKMFLVGRKPGDKLHVF